MHTIDYRESRLTIDGDGIARFQHQRPATRNALTMALRADYAEMVDQLRGNSQVRALILAGSGGSFCAGGDVKGMLARFSDPAHNTPVHTRQRLLDLNGWIQRLRELEVPVIAAVDGPAWGGGFAIALCADFVLATPRASFCMVFLRLGVIPDMSAIHLLPRVVGLQKAKELLMTGRRVDAAEAQSLGLVLAQHEPEALDDAALALARRFLPAERVALGMTKRMANRAYETDAGAMAELESAAQAICVADEAHLDCIRRFAAKQPMAYDWDRGVDAAAQ